MEINYKDSELLKHLSKKGKASQRELAEATGFALGTVSNRLKTLEKENIIRGYTADIDPEKVGFTLTATIHLRITKGKIMSVQNSIAKHPRVFAVYDITGEWDSLVLARFKDREEMDDFIKTILSQKNIERTSSSLVLNNVKEDMRIVI